ncbi:MAG: integrase core domain-containing protein, partial [Actinomycetota bacterium]|nr:integrase core domain-containing protein [Actinomycetota bacterium]
MRETGHHVGGLKVTHCRGLALELELVKPRVSFAHSQPYHPETWGEAERFQQTLEALALHPHTLGALQADLATFRRYYNARRPHRATRSAKYRVDSPGSSPFTLALHARPGHHGGGADIEHYGSKTGQCSVPAHV